MNDGPWIELLTPGTYRLSDGREVTYTRADTANAEKQGNAMLREGLRVPLCWMHDPQAVPQHLSRMHADAWLARGYFGDAAQFMRVDDRLYVRPRVTDPGDLAQFNRVKGVSPRCQWDWRDETGKVWKGLTIGHVAATPTPIQRTAGKPLPAYPPELLSHDPARCRAVEYLSYGTRTGDAPVDKTPKKDDAGDKGGSSDDMGGGCSPKDCAEMLQKAGLHLGEVSSWEEFATALKAAVSTLHGPDQDGDDDGLQDAEPAAMPPAMMSHIQSHYDAAGVVTRATTEQEINNLQRNGQIDPATRTRLLGELKAADLSHSAFDLKTGKLKPSPLMAEIAAYKKLPHGRFSKKNKAGDLSHTGTTEPATRPNELDPKDGVAAELADVEKRFAAKA